MTEATCNAALLAILERLARLPDADRILVFGSVVTDKSDPSDVDILYRHGVSAHSADVARFYDPLRPLLQIALRHYGLFDPFVVDDRGLLQVRSGDARSWVHAKRARAILKAARRDGRTIAEAIAIHRAKLGA